MQVDLHIHSAASDGTDAPGDLPRLALAAGLKAFALTDHDTTAGLAACARAARKLGIDFMPGIELSADPASIHPQTAARPTKANPRPPSPVRAGTLHILGYGIRHDDPELASVQQQLIQTREQRNPAMIENLNRLGVKITYDEVLALAQQQGASIVGRPHIAQVMLHKGYVKSIHEAFIRYIGEGAAAYVRKDRLSVQHAIETIHQAGGIAALAHPVQLRPADPHDLKSILRRLKDFGLDALETHHSDHTPADIDRFEKLAAHFNLLAVGGSDYHGERKTIRLASAGMSLANFEKVVAAVAARQS